jgi:hypothetical protein
MGKFLAEREGFEPPIALRLCLISSQVHSTGLCHLSALFTTTYVPVQKSLELLLSVSIPDSSCFALS